MKLSLEMNLTLEYKMSGFGNTIGAAVGAAITLHVVDKAVLSKLKKKKGDKKIIDKFEDDYLFDY